MYAVSLLQTTFPYTIKNKSTLSIYSSVTTYITTEAPGVCGGGKGPSSGGRLQESNYLGFALLLFCLGLGGSTIIHLPIQPLSLSASELLNSFPRADFVG